MTEETFRLWFGGGSSLAEDEAALKQGGARGAFAGLFAATAALTGVAMTARMVTRAVGSREYGFAKGRRDASSRSADCRIVGDNHFRTGVPGQKEGRLGIDIGFMHALMPRQTLTEALFGENGESVADVYLEPIREHGTGDDQGIEKAYCQAV